MVTILLIWRFTFHLCYYFPTETWFLKYFENEYILNSALLKNFTWLQIDSQDQALWWVVSSIDQGHSKIYVNHKVHLTCCVYSGVTHEHAAVPRAGLFYLARELG